MLPEDAQLGFIVEDMDLGLATWDAVGHTQDRRRIWRYDPTMVADTTYRDRRSDYTMWLAFSSTEGYASHDTRDILGVYLEAIEMPGRRRDPHRSWR